MKLSFAKLRSWFRSDYGGAWLDVFAMALTLAGTWALAYLGIPELIVAYLTTENAAILTTESGVPITTEPDPHALTAFHHYYRIAIPALIAISFAGLIQIRRSLAILLARKPAVAVQQEPEAAPHSSNSEKIFKRCMRGSFFWAIAGLVLTLMGTVVTASGVIMTDSQATRATTLRWDEQIELKQTFLDASHGAVWGLLLVVLGSICQAISLIQFVPKSRIRKPPVPTVTTGGRMIEVLKISVPKDKLRAMPQDERALLILLGYMANNITMLTKLVIFSTNKTPDGVERLASNGQSQMLARLVIGFQHEAYEFIKTRFLGSTLGKKYVPLLDAEGKAALDGLKKTFGGSNILSKLRNQFIFHMPGDPKVLDVAFEAAAKDPALDNDWLWLFSHSNLNTFYYINDFIVMHAIMNEVGETNLIDAQKKIMADVQSVAENLAQFVMALMVALWKENFGHVLDAEVVERISNAPNWLEHWYPFYVDLSGDPPPPTA